MSAHDKPLAMNGPTYEAAKEIGRLEYKIGKLRGALKFVETDPCFKLLGTVTQDEVRVVLWEYP